LFEDFLCGTDWSTKLHVWLGLICNNPIGTSISFGALAAAILFV